MRSGEPKAHEIFAGIVTSHFNTTHATVNQFDKVVVYKLQPAR